MKKAPIPPNEAERLANLKSFQILDTSPEASFDQITELAAAICKTKISLVSLVDEKRQWFKSAHGFDARETSRDISYCGHAIQSDEIFEVEDSALHPDFCDNPLFLNEPNVRFYAGAPLITSRGHRIGTLCVIDPEAKKLDELQKQTLRVLASQVVSLLELKLHRDHLQSTADQLREAQEIARIGSWYYNLETNEQIWTTEHYKIFEIPEPQPQDQLFQLYRDRIHPEDLPRLDELKGKALEKSEVFTFDHRVVLDGGKRIKHVRSLGRVVRDSSGKPQYLCGTCQDRTQDVVKDNQYRTLFETMSEGLVLQNSQGAIITYNRAALEILNLTEDQLLGRTSEDPHWQAIREDGSPFPGAEHPAMVALKSGRPVFGVRMGLKQANGETRWIQINAVPTIDASERQVMTTFSDITELIETQWESKYVLDTLEIGVFKFNPRTQELHWDQSMFKVFGVEPSEFSGTYEAWEARLTPESKAKSVEAVNRALAGEKELDFTFEIQTRLGERRFIGGRGLVLRDEQNQPLMMYGINWDRTPEVQLEFALERERAKAMHNAKLASLGEMSAGIAHEINNPLAIISANLQLFEKMKDDPSKWISKIASIERATERIAKIVKGLRKFSRSSTISVYKPEILKELVQEALVFTDHKARKNNVSVQLDLQSESKINCDGVEIQQVVVNLVNNAIDAIKDLEDKWIQVRSFDEGASVILQVIDSGTGIPAEIEPKLFEPFFTTKPVGEGTGLGLSISKGILDQHKAQFHVNRQLPNTCFEVRFPRFQSSEKSAA